MEFNINEILSLFIIIIFYLNLSALQMKESLECGPLETIRIIVASWKFAMSWAYFVIESAYID